MNWVLLVIIVITSGFVIKSLFSDSEKESYEYKKYF